MSGHQCVSSYCSAGLAGTAVLGPLLGTIQIYKCRPYMPICRLFSDVILVYSNCLAHGLIGHFDKK